VALMLRERGYHHIYESWEGKIDTALGGKSP
jgi:hypothetical protein